MAKEQDKTVIGLSRGVIGTVVLVLSVATGIAFWSDRGGSQAKAEAVHESVVSSLLLTDQRHDREIAQNSKDVKSIRDEHHRAEVARTKLEGKVDLVGSGITEMKQDFKDFKQFLMQYDYDNRKETE